MTDLLLANVTKDLAGGTVAIRSFYYVGADDADGHIGIADHCFGNGADQQLADRTRRVSPHHDPIDPSLVEECEDAVCGPSGPDHDFALNSDASGSLAKRFKTEPCLTGIGEFVAAMGRRRRCWLFNTIENMEDDELRAKLGGKTQRECKGFLIGGKL